MKKSTKRKPTKRKEEKFMMCHGRKKLDVQDALAFMAHTIAYMKDERCENSGFNWLGRFYDECSIALTSKK